MRTLIIAEAGVNHNGSLEIALKLVDAAVDANADFVKFQTFKADNLVSKNAEKADYQKRNIIGNDNSQYQMLKDLELSKKDHLSLQAYCLKKGIGFLSTGFDEESIDFLAEIQIPFFKIPSGEITNLPLIKHVALKGKPVILSTGMSNIDEIKRAFDTLILNGISKEKITLLHCNTEYPTPMRDVNLKAMLKLKEEFGTTVGYSDHTVGIEVSIAAVALGANVIEKHFTIDRNMEGPDHAASLEPNELKAMIDAIRNIELALSGSGKKEPSFSELKNRDIARKSIHVLNPIKKGETIKSNDLIMKRPGDGISPAEMEQIIGKKANIDLFPDYKITWNDIR